MPYPQQLPPNAPLTWKPPGPPMTHKRALAFVAGVLTFFTSIFVLLAGFAFVLFAAADIDRPGSMLVTGLYGIVSASFGFMGGVNMVKARNYRFCLTGAILLCISGLFPFVLGLDSEFHFPAAYVIALMVPAVALVLAASGDFVEPEPKPASGGGPWGTRPSTAGPPGVVWPPSPGATSPSPPAGSYRAIPPPPPPPFVHPNPPRLLYLKDVGQGRADKAGALLVLSAAFLVFFGMMGVIWPNNMPGFGLGLASLLGAILALAASYLALLRIRKGLAVTMASYVLLAYALLTVDVIDADGVLGLIYFLPLVVLPAVGLVLMARAYQEKPPPFGAPAPTAPIPPQ